MLLLLLLWLSAVPQNQILVKGAAPAASDTTTPLPEGGRVAGGSYRNAYFGLTYPLPAGWTEQPAGPPPSDTGGYVLAHIGTSHAYVAVTAQDLFFSVIPLADAQDLVTTVRRNLSPAYAIESEPAAVTIAGRTFHRFAYRAPLSGLRWRVLTTDTRCHALTFTFAGTDVAALNAAEQAMSLMSLKSTGPTCVANYAKRVVVREDPIFPTARFNTIPVRVLIDAKGRVKHVHVLSAFPEQTQAILAAVRKWKFAPHPAGEVETGLVLGRAP